LAGSKDPLNSYDTKGENKKQWANFGNLKNIIIPELQEDKIFPCFEKGYHTGLFHANHYELISLISCIRVQEVRMQYMKK
jgi:hypothetical protein